MEEIKVEKESKKIPEKADDHKEKLTEIQPNCPNCGSDNVFGMSRVVGYFSIIENWNDSKRAELKRRQQGNYWHEEEEDK
jgi:anaerobic ribonucleoside-triphosphate reductase